MIKLVVSSLISYAHVTVVTTLPIEAVSAGPAQRSFSLQIFLRVTSYNNALYVYVSLY